MEEWKKERRYESTPRYYILFYLFFSFFLFRFFLDVLCGERVYVDCPPGVGVHPSSGSKQEEKERGIFGVLCVFQETYSMEPDER